VLILLRDVEDPRAQALHSKVDAIANPDPEALRWGRWTPRLCSCRRPTRPGK
jgi:hypothetical protein